MMAASRRNVANDPDTVQRVGAIGRAAIGRRVV